jgi:hypothetical protein
MRKYKDILLILACASLLFFLWAKADLLMPLIFGSEFLKEDKQTFNAFSSLLSGFALIGVVLTVYLQQKELSLQRQELQNTREVFETQKFENTFFNLVQVHQNILEKIKYQFTESSGDTGIINNYSGKDFFQFLEAEFRLLYKGFKAFNTNPITANISHDSDFKLKKIFNQYEIDIPKLITKIKKNKFSEIELGGHIYEIMFKKHAHSLAHYFRNLYHILNFISEAKAKKINSDKGNSKKEAIIDEFKGYADFLQAQLSPSELFIMMYNGFLFPKAKKLIDEFMFIENLSEDNVPNEEHSGFYSFPFK